MPQESENPRPRLRSRNKVGAEPITSTSGTDCDEVGNRECFQPPEVSAVLQARCQRLSILPSAVESWAEVYSEPIHGLICYTGVAIGMEGCTLYRLFDVVRGATCAHMFLIIQKAPTLSHRFTYAYAGILTYPVVLAILSFAVIFACIWRYGPSVLRAGAMKPWLLITGVSNTCNVVAGFLVPPEHTPFGSALHNTVVAGLMALSVNAAYLLVPLQSPPQPRPSVFPVLLEAVTLTLRMLDALTDVTFVHVLLEEVRRSPLALHCVVAWSHGPTGRCFAVGMLAVVSSSRS